MADSESSSTKKDHHHHHHHHYLFNGSKHHEDSHDYKQRRHDSKNRHGEERVRSDRSVKDLEIEQGDPDNRSLRNDKVTRSERVNRDIRNGRSDTDNRSERTDKESEHRSHKSRDRERGHDRDRDRERRHRRKSRSRSRGRSKHHSRSRSGSPDRRSSKRQSGFDMAPPAAAVAGVTLPGQLPSGPPAAVPAVPGMFAFATAQFSGMPTLSMQSMTQQATRHARRVYVGGLPPLANEQTIATFFSQVMAAIGGNTAGPGDAVVNVYINHEKKFAFVEMRTVEEASNAMALDGIIFEGVSVRVRRPTDYNPSVAATLGPSQPSPHLNLAAVGLTPGAIGGADGPDRVFVGGLPYYLTEVQIRELLESFGPLRGFDLVKDQDTGNSKGYGFCVYQDPAVTDVACAALNGLKMGDKTLTVRRATASGQPKPDQVGALAQAQQQFAIQVGGNATASLAGFPGLMTALPASIISEMMTGMTNGTMTLESPTKVVCLSQVVTLDELKEDDVYEEIYDDMKDECSKYGTLLNLVIPRPAENEDTGTGVGKVFLQYNDEKEATKAKDALHGRKFGGNTVLAVFYPEDKFSLGEYD